MLIMKQILILASILTILAHCAKLKSTFISKKAEPDWWTHSIVYQIYPRSFKDSDNDGIGDLQGIIQKLNYLADLGVDAIWLSPIYKSPMVDGGYDISDYEAIAEEYGTLDDFKELLSKAHNLGLKIIMDFVLNHSSDLHEWFTKSVTRETGFEDFYIWNDGILDEEGNKQPPNNWLSLWDNSAWEWNEIRQQYYFHQFSKQQPDLNYRNHLVRQAMENVLIYWLDLGVDGFRVDALPHLYEDELLRDEPVINSDVPNSYNSLNHTYTKEQPETFEYMYNLRDIMDNYTQRVGGDTRIFMTECSSPVELINKYYGNGTRLGAHFSFNFNFLALNENSTAKDIYIEAAEWYTTINITYTLNWLTGNHDNHRVASRVGSKNVDAYNMLIAFLDGVTVTYMAEEIGQENGEVTCEEGQDPSAIGNCTTFAQVSRDFERTPFQWDSSVNAGFNQGTKPWLPVGSKYLETNLAAQVDDENSHYNIYKTMIGLKPLLQSNELISLAYDENDGVFSASRVSLDPSKPKYVFIYNVNVTKYAPRYAGYNIMLKSGNLDVQPGKLLILKPGDAVILELENDGDDSDVDVKLGQ
ncbi:unnamed protein product [Ceutorhynchus assimilis]|uniref:alpha-glucosidase n=1 Tax=Ceutorhynchus assimilis TaxID=467358 RepID=A0A9N9QE47_9CUCU|nr:unnamed protein product [Ceutorhynchus assimilis]